MATNHEEVDSRAEREESEVIWKGVAMTIERYPADTIIELADFDASECQLILNSASRRQYSSYHDAFSKAAREASQISNLKKAKIYWLLADACSLMLVPENRNQPFKPFAVFGDRRSAVPDDFSEDEISFLAAIVPEVTDPQLKARLAELAWLKGRPRNKDYALIAVDSYRQIPLDAETWISDGKECWYRAIVLALLLGSGAGDRIQSMENDIQRALDSSSKSDGYLGFWLAELLVKCALGKNDEEKNAAKLEGLARKFEADGDWHRAREYYDLSAKLYSVAGTPDKSNEIVVALAKTYEQQARAHSDAAPPNNIAAASLYEKAIQILRTIQRKDRATLEVENYISELQKSLNQAGQLSLLEMKTISTGPTDITELVVAARSSVAEKSAPDALRSFANIFPGMSFSKMCETAIEHITQYPLTSFLAGSYISQDGRVIAKTDGITFHEDLNNSHPRVLSSVMLSHGLHLTLVAQGNILPAMDILHLEHSLSYADFIAITKESPIIPPGREGLFAKGLFAGYEYDYVTALHILAPQIEHMVRYHLKEAGAKTTTLDAQGIENETGLSKLVELPEMKEVFGEDITFEIKALFCDPLGANFRNEIAHGLIESSSCNSLHGVYAWWFTLKLVFNTFWNAARKGNQPTAVNDQEQYP